MELGVTVTLGVMSGSLALIAFGLDSIAEVLASSAVLWSFRGGIDAERSRAALRVVAAAFFLLAAVLVTGGVYNLATGHRPETSTAGIAYLAVTATAMFALAIAKRRTAIAETDHSLVHETRVTVLDGTLALAVLLALVVNATAGWWWADSVAALLIAAAAVVEGALAPRIHDPEPREWE